MRITDAIAMAERITAKFDAKYPGKQKDKKM